MKITTSDGYIEFDNKHDLNAEEGDDYLPKYYQGRVMELCMIKSRVKGGGHRLMQTFLNHAQTKSAKVIFLDCSPLYMEGNEMLIMARLHDFYAQYGFVGKTNNGYSRMWRFQALPISMKDGVDFNYNKDNDFHPVLVKMCAINPTLSSPKIAI